MKKIILIIVLLMFANVSYSADFYFRNDGGMPGVECDGSKDIPKSRDKKCAYSFKYMEVIDSKNSDDNYIISDGSFAINIGPTPLWITEDQFNDRPGYYNRQAISGRKVYIKIDGLPRLLQLDKY